MIIRHTISELSVVEGKTVLANLAIYDFTSDKDETFDEAMLRALRCIQLQLAKNDVSDSVIDNALEAVVSILSLRIRPTKRKSYSYREFTLPH